MGRIERFGLDFPEDFPAAELEAVHAHLSDTGDCTQTPEWGEWAAACNGIVFRFLALNEHGAALSSSLDEALAPPMPERYRQERLLFAFFSEGLSCLECCYYGLYFVGALVDAQSFDPRVVPRSVTPAFVTQKYGARFGGDPLTEAMRGVDQSAEADAWRKVRNVLSHRSSPGRAFFKGGPQSGSVDWMGGDLSADAIRERRTWMAAAVATILVPAVDFVRRQLTS